MKTARYFTHLLKQAGFNFFSGVPCSFLTQVINQAITDPELDYVAATSEGEAVALAAGAWLAGKQSVVMCQNSGLGNMINPLTSLNAAFAIPVLLMVTHRGKPGIKDEPQHRLMGEITPDLLALLGIPSFVLPATPAAMEEVISHVMHQVQDKQKTVALIVEKGIFSESSSDKNIQCTLPSRAEVLEQLLELAGDQDFLIATTGKTGRELFTLNDRPNNLYCVGSMGYASALAQGIALYALQRTVTIIDGDGAALMHPGNMATIGHLRSPNIIHLLLNNGTYDSTGGQKTLADSVDFAQLALGMGYVHARYCTSHAELAEAYRHAREFARGPVLLIVNIANGSMGNLGRPTVTPEQIARRLQHQIKESFSHDRQFHIE
ncbi:phosphonopyruvate decarboxylase [Xenorhabdus bovienii]|uniref:phosphonopyruvate decarboxylase n=1 Tax=Xenorhabdus bovienii TaxID=40576 RepID=UPI0023B26206|nr:phosphonopyruvate decarboxylase [Xenorhabdus bovienii]MDE9437860.1 phosphonopyruvate decarboxylase [Xenorhabdus bovienii]MDE9466909.1 phosphonopyruvate decarboxylase [Xenorhabdus bovienii]MDE9499656.1 phosphonopyruvate decarboxylase [Xenorhabdus bovienii]